MTHRNPGALLVIGSGLKLYREYIVRAVARRAREAGLRLVLINNLRPTWQREHFDDITVVDVFDHDRLRGTARELAGRFTITGLMCWDEPLVMPAAELAAEFGVPGLSIPGVQGCRDKHSSRTRLTAAGLPQPGFALTTGLDQARRAAARIGYPVVVKPRALGASMGVSLAAGERELAYAYRIAHEASLVGDAPYRGGAIIEGYADGPEISIDGAVHKGEYLPMFLARKTTGLPPFFEELGHVVDAADPLLRDPVLLKTLETAHRVLGIEDGITHTEVRLTADGPVIIEVNGRLGGDLIPYLGQVATGIEPGSVLFDIATGRRPDLTTTASAVAGIRFGYPGQDCTVRSIAVPAEAPGLILAAGMVEPGTVLRLPPGGYIARHSLVVCSAPDPSSCAQRLTDAAALVEVDADPVDPPPAGTPLTMPAGLLDVDA
ncbi:carboxylase [Actinoplanes sp. NBRC 14428]|nr:carboxylase [Actinoplanes sp. NBRC 14428]